VDWIHFAGIRVSGGSGEYHNGPQVFHKSGKFSQLTELILIEVIIVSLSDDVLALSCPVYRGRNIISRSPFVSQEHISYWICRMIPLHVWRVKLKLNVT
jgi:hypothetical protein